MRQSKLANVADAGVGSRGWSTAVLLAIAFAFSACGAQSEEERVVERVKAAHQAYLDKDGEAFCDLLTGEGKQKILAATLFLGEKDCASSVERTLDSVGPEDFADTERSQDALEPDDVRIRGDRATVSFVSGNEQPVRKVGDEWYIDGLSAKPRGG
jgi:hypothetical protein